MHTLRLWLSPEECEAVEARNAADSAADFAYSEELALSWAREEALQVAA